MPTLVVRAHWAIPSAAALFLVATLVPASSVEAQQPSTRGPAEVRLQGVVVDESTYQPIESATVSLVGTDFEALTGRWGAFSFADAPLGSVSVRVTAQGRPSVVQNVEVGADRSLFVQVVLPSVAATLSELFVQGSRAASLEGARTAADLLALKVPDTRVLPSVLGNNESAIHLRGANTLMQGVEPLILIDGAMISRTRDALDVLNQIPASDVQEIEILRGPAAAFLYPFAANGVVNVKTRSGSRAR